MYRQQKDGYLRGREWGRIKNKGGQVHGDKRLGSGWE